MAKFLTWLRRKGGSLRTAGPGSDIEREVGFAELTVLGMDRLLLVRCDLIDTRWTLRSSGFVNRDLMIAPVLAKGVATYAYIGDVPYEIDLNIIGRRLGIGDLVYFRPGQITVHTKWFDTQRKLTQQGSRLTTC